MIGKQQRMQRRPWPKGLLHFDGAIPAYRYKLRAHNVCMK